MRYSPGDQVLLATDHPDGLLVRAVPVDAVVERGETQVLTVDGRSLSVGPDGTGDHDGVSVLPLSDDVARELYVRGEDRLVVTATRSDSYDISQDHDGPDDDLRIRGPLR